MVNSMQTMYACVHNIWNSEPDVAHAQQLLGCPPGQMHASFWMLPQEYALGLAALGQSQNQGLPAMQTIQNT